MGPSTLYWCAGTGGTASSAQCFQCLVLQPGGGVITKGSVSHPSLWVKEGKPQKKKQRFSGSVLSFTHELPNAARSQLPFPALLLRSVE